MSESLKNILDTLLRTAVMNSFNTHELHFISQETNDSATISAVAPAAKLKERGVLLGGIDQVRLQNSVDNFASNYQRLNLPEAKLPPRKSSIDVSENSTLQSRRHQMRYLTLPERILLSEYRQLAWYDNKPVLLEWRSVNRSNSPRVEYRVDKVSALLHELADPSFHSLVCRGYIKDHESGRYGHVFELPYTTERGHRNIHTLRPRSKLPPLPAMRTLREMLSTPSARPSLNLRISYAIILFETILQLHTAGWLHKELRSENILFIQTSSTESPSNQSLLRSRMYLAGYVYARADSPLEFTEPLESEAEMDLYRHPLYLGNTRLAYRKSFDIFSIGCILLEIGLWSSLAAVLRAYGRQKRAFASEHMKSASSECMTSSPSSLAFSLSSTPDPDDGTLDLMRARRDILCSINSPTDIKDCNNIFNMLEAQMGTTYTKVVVDCLQAETRENKPGGIDEHKYALELEKNALAQFISISERI
jgi:serine/threonine protein kinase